MRKPRQQAARAAKRADAQREAIKRQVREELRFVVAEALQEHSGSPALQALAKVLCGGVVPPEPKILTIFVCPNCGPCRDWSRIMGNTDVAHCVRCSKDAPGPFWTHFYFARPLLSAAEAAPYGI